MSEGKRPIVLSPAGKFREGRGFSLGELKLANIGLREARKIGLIVDKRRKSVYDENVKALLGHLSKLSKKPVN